MNTIFWEIRQQLEIGDATVTANAAARRADELKSAHALLSDRIERLALASEAVWTLLQEKFGLSEDDLRARITEVDATDGQLDGRVRRAPLECTACGRTSPRSWQHCMYCGELMSRDALGL